MSKTAVPVFLLTLSLGWNVPVDAFNSGITSQQPAPIPQEKKPDSTPEQSQKSDQNNLPADNARVVLPDGTPVRLKFVRAVVSSQVIAGDKVPLEVIEPLLVSKLVAIPEHSAQEAIVTVAQGGRTMGRGGTLQFKIENIRLADGELVPVRAVKDVKSETSKAVRIATFPVWDYLIGKSARVPAGAEITAYIARDFPLDPSKFHVTGPNPREKNEPK